MPLERLRSSGRIAPRFVPIALGAIVAAALLAWPYQKLIGWIPYIYLSLLVYLAVGFGVAMLVLMANQLGKNRNRLVGALFGLVVAATTVGVSHYVAYRTLITDIAEKVAGSQVISVDDAEDEVARVLTFGRYLDARVETGWSLGRHSRSFGGDEDPKGDISGVMVWIIWGIEGGVLLGVGAFVGAKREPFCEDCQRWMDEREVGARRGGPESLAAAKAANHVSELADLPPPAEDDPAMPRLVFSAHTCPRCQGPGYLTVTKVWFKQGKNGPEKQTDELHSHLVVPRDQLARFS